MTLQNPPVVRAQMLIRKPVANVLDPQLPQENCGRQLFTKTRDLVYKVIFESAHQGLAWAG
jgi:hypothetical protein